MATLLALNSVFYVVVFSEGLWHEWGEPYDYLSSFLIHNEGNRYSELKRMMASQTWLALDLNSMKLFSGTEKHEPTLHEVKVELTWPKGSISNNTGEPLTDKLGCEPETQSQILEESEATTMGAASDEDFIYFAMHLPSKLPNSRNQPFSSINDGMVLLPEGHVFQIRAKISRYSNLKSTKYKCTNGVSMSDWQVSNRVSLSALDVTVITLLPFETEKI
jgi:hypothetical protein